MKLGMGQLVDHGSHGLFLTKIIIDCNSFLDLMIVTVLTFHLLKFHRNR